MATSRRPAAPSLAANLRPLLRRRRKPISLGDLAATVGGDDGLAPVLFVLTLPVLAPLPPGVSVIFAIPPLLIALQIVAGRPRLWLPAWLAKRSFKPEALASALSRGLPVISRIEALVRPRLGLVTGRLGARLVGVACVVNAVILILPIPFANLVPALAMGCLALGLARRDGLVVLAGYALMALAAGVIALGVDGAAAAVHHLRQVF